MVDKHHAHEGSGAVRGYGRARQGLFPHSRALVCACCFCCVDAIFVRTGTVLPGIDGREWRADKEFSFSLFRRALKGMRGGKAVGLTGFSVELLRVFDQAGKGESEVLRLMYEAIMLASLRKLRGWEVAEGRAESSNGLWAVESLTGVRRPTVRRGRQLEVTVRWAGVNPLFGCPWGDSILPITSLTPDLRRRARLMEQEVYPGRRRLTGRLHCGFKGSGGAG